MPLNTRQPLQSFTPRKFRLLIWSVVIGGTVAFGVEVYSILFGLNFHAVIPGRVYRCAEPSAADLRRAVAQYGIRTVVNLRGCSDGYPWYDEESRATAELDISQEDVRFSAVRLPAPNEVKRLLEVFDNAEYPILIHCKRGVDRTGLASTIAKLLLTNATPAEARGQLSVRYGHVRFGRTAAMLNFFDLYDHWRIMRAQTHSHESLRSFLTEGYCPGRGRAHIEVIDSPTFAANQVGQVRVRVHNQSVEPWHFHAHAAKGIHLRYDISDLRDHPKQVGQAGLFETVVAPNQSVDLALAIDPLPLGTYRFIADMIDIGETRFSQLGSEPLIVEFVVP